MDGLDSYLFTSVLLVVFFYQCRLTCTEEFDTFSLMTAPSPCHSSLFFLCFSFHPPPPPLHPVSFLSVLNFFPFSISSAPPVLGQGILPTLNELSQIDGELSLVHVQPWIPLWANLKGSVLFFENRTHGFQVVHKVSESYCFFGTKFDSCWSNTMTVQEAGLQSCIRRSIYCRLHGSGSQKSFQSARKF